MNRQLNGYNSYQGNNQNAPQQSQYNNNRNYNNS
jgi:hypothetical protein